MKTLPLVASVLAATVLLSACDDAALRGWNTMFGDDKKNDEAEAAPARQRPAEATRATATAAGTPAAPPMATSPPITRPAQVGGSDAWPMAPVPSSMPVPPPAPAIARQGTQPFAFEGPGDRSTDDAATCDFDRAGLPPDTKVFAAGAYGGRTLDYQIDQSGHEATRIDVAVNQRKTPVVLMLGAYEPTVWNVGWSKGTRIVAVLVSGYHRQAIAGLPATVPVRVSTYDNHGACGHFYVNPDDVGDLNPIAQRAFGRRVDRVYPAANGRVVIGDALVNVEMVTVNGASANAFRNPDAPLAGPAGIEQAVRQGLLREATAADLAAWRRTQAQTRDLPPVEGASAATADTARLYRVYVVNKAFVLPAGLYGANSVTLIVPKGIARPTGELGHSQMLDYNTLGCVGLTCGR